MQIRRQRFLRRPQISRFICAHDAQLRKNVSRCWQRWACRSSLYWATDFLRASENPWKLALARCSPAGERRSRWRKVVREECWENESRKFLAVRRISPEAFSLTAKKRRRTCSGYLKLRIQSRKRLRELWPRRH